jgi:hypothetical protein
MNIVKVLSGNSLVRAARDRHIARVLSDGGIIQSVPFIQEWYNTVFGLGLQIRRSYDALAGVKLNNQGGIDHVQVMYDFGNTNDARVDAIQTTAGQQPIWGTDADLPAGIRAPIFDGTNDFIPVNDLGIFNAQAAGTLMAVVKDLNRTGGDTSHNPIFISDAAGTASRASLFTRYAGASEFAAAGRRVDGTTISASTLISANGLNHLTGLFNWGGNALQGIFNGTPAAVANYATGGGITSSTNSGLFNIGAFNNTTNRLNGIISSVTAARIVLTAQQEAAIRNLRKSFYPALP